LQIDLIHYINVFYEIKFELFFAAIILFLNEKSNKNTNSEFYVDIKFII